VELRDIEQFTRCEADRRQQNHLGKHLPRLADLIAERAQVAALGVSWQAAAPKPEWKPMQAQSWHR
jgi:hypothetical protein